MNLFRRALRSALSGAAGTVVACVAFHFASRREFAEQVTTITDQEHQ